MLFTRTFPNPLTTRRRGSSAFAYPTPNVFVDSVGGSDSNDGLTSSTPKQTLAAALAIAPTSGLILGLKNGSHWRASLDVSSFTAPIVTRYGSGCTAPIIDGADVFSSGWTKTAGRTNVYEVSVTHDATSTNRLTVYEDGALLTRVTSLATCDSTAGSFVEVLGSAGSPVTVRIHANGTDKNPLTNGKTYDITTRTIAFFGPDDCTVYGIRTQRCCNNNGSFDLVNKLDGVAERIIAKDGTKHNLGMGSGFVRDCIAIDSDDVTLLEPSNTSGVSFVTDGTGLTYSWERFGVIDCVGVHFLSHGSPTGFTTGSLTQNWVVNTGFIGTGVDVSVGCFYKTNSALPQVLQSMFMATGTTGSTSLSGTWADCVFTTSGRPLVEFLRSNGGTLQNCAGWSNEGNALWFSNGSTTNPLTVNKSIFYGAWGLIILPSGYSGTYTGNYNVFHSYGGTLYFNKGAGLITGLAAWQSATGQDAQSVYIVNADQTSGGANAFWLGVSLGINAGPSDGDWRINPNARVYSAGGTAYIGTFPDGTLITTAGPRNHWDWNTRAEVSGPPEAWPTVPENLTDAETYVCDPEGWNFYP